MVVVANNCVCLGTRIVTISAAGMHLNRLHQVRRAAIVQKKIRWPNPHKGAVRNSSPPAAPCPTLSARFGPM